MRDGSSDWESTALKTQVSWVQIPVVPLSFFIIIRGPLGVGKTTIAKFLAERLDGERIDFDKILSENGLDEVSAEEGGIPLDNFIKANDLVIPDAKKKIEAGKVLIFDACFYHKEVIDDLIKKLPYKHFVFTLKASLDNCVLRDKCREKSYGKDAAEFVHLIVSKFDYGIIIETSCHTKEQTVEEVLSHIQR